MRDARDAGNNPGCETEGDEDETCEAEGVRFAVAGDNLKGEPGERCSVSFVSTGYMDGFNEDGEDEEEEEVDEDEEVEVEEEEVALRNDEDDEEGTGGVRAGGGKEGTAEHFRCEIREDTCEDV
ncbi:hypothetical protein FACS189472_09660 [Alphaproteobacteria bacterium]|nr:hypothetical protein FACS189472_09660 [Alphaproteobacteria bacterium]